MGVPKNGWFIRENPTKMDDLGVPLFQETSIYFLPETFCELKHSPNLGQRGCPGAKAPRCWCERPSGAVFIGGFLSHGASPVVTMFQHEVVVIHGVVDNLGYPHDLGRLHLADLLESELGTR